MPKPPQDLREVSSLIRIVADLRGPDGCPWDKEQTHLTLTPYAVEEVGELVEAIESKDDSKTKDELGDVLFQVVLHAQLASERGAFSFADVVQNLSEKMIRRHPHVFSDTRVSGSGDVVRNWDEIKKAEKAAAAGLDGGAGAGTAAGAVTSGTAAGALTSGTAAGAAGPGKTLDVPIALPALQRAAKIGSRTRKLKFDWQHPDQVMEKIREEIAEFEEALEEGSDDAVSHELGDVLFSLAQMARHLERDPEQILREANRRFETRFETMMEICRERGLEWMTLDDETREALWGAAKERTAK